MTVLPYSGGSFDAAIALWSAFHELLDVDQLSALSEIWRVLAPGGLALIEGPPYSRPTDGQGPEGRISWSLVGGLPYPHYHHDESSLGRVCMLAGIATSHVFEREWGGRQRLILRLDKETG